MRFKFGQKTIDFFRKDLISYLVLAKSEYIIKKNLKKLKNKKTVKVAFLQMYATSIQNLPIFELMLKDELFDPYFIINPDIQRSKENFDFNYKRTKNELTEKYGADRVLNGYDFDKNQYFDYTDKFDIVFTNNPYDNMAHKYFQIKYWRKNNIPVLYSNYSYVGMVKYSDRVYSLNEFKYMWKIFTETDFSKDMMLHCGVKKEAIEVVGYAKLDKISKIKENKRKRKKIIIAPHHTIIEKPKFLNIGAFLKYHDLILRLPKMFPQIDFVFRPHPMLIEVLKTECWGGEKTKKYLEELTSFKNLEYQTKGDYLETFVNSDALIQDCGSFLAEYFYTNHPQCYMFKSQDVIDKEFTRFGKEMLNHVYKAFSDDDIINFINDVVLSGNDIMQEARKEFAESKIKINYPYTTNKIVETVKQLVHKNN